MGFREIDIKESYRSNEYDDLGTQFISKMLEKSVIYKRAVGFFSSSALLKISKGISYLAQKEGSHIYFVVSPILYKEDIDAIKQGYKNRRKAVEDALLRQFKDTTDEFDCERLNYLCHLIEEGILDIKIADKIDDYSNSEIGMFHEKIGLFIDENEDKIAFTGSLNESDNAYSRNFESIQVFKSWEETKRVAMIEDDFNHLWDNKTRTLEIYDFPDAVKKCLFKYRKSTYHKNIDEYERREKFKIEQTTNHPEYRCKFPLYQYQKDAINKWAHQDYRGLFDMGTGTGKTVTALTASVKLLERLKYRLATIIVCPYTHLVEQWVEEQENFNIRFIVGYSNPRYKDYLSNLANTIQDYNDGICNYFFFITTNDSYKTDKVQHLLRQIKGSVLFIADEVHNVGSSGFRDALIDSFKYRIGLSATIDRHHDEEGTSLIYDYFGNPVIHYGLKEAIEDNVLTRYYYYPIPVTLSDDEIDKYKDLTEKIRKGAYSDANGNIKLTDAGKRYAIARARIIASAQNKIEALKNAIKDYKNDYNLLIYCGTGKIKDASSGEEEKQIDEVCKLLGNELKVKVARFTSKENASERKQIIERYKTGDDLQAIVAIKCLDEGVNIPSIKTAFILASSTNPREYIQRRGRVLRKFDGKKYSYIYDFITLPVDINSTQDYSDEFLSSFNTLANNEVERIKEFSKLAENEHESDIIISRIKEIFKLNEFKIDIDKFKHIDWEEINYGD